MYVLWFRNHCVSLVWKGKKSPSKFQHAKGILAIPFICITNVIRYAKKDSFWKQAAEFPYLAIGSGGHYSLLLFLLQYPTQHFFCSCFLLLFCWLWKVGQEGGSPCVRKPLSPIAGSPLLAFIAPASCPSWHICTSTICAELLALVCAAL